MTACVKGYQTAAAMGPGWSRCPVHGPILWLLCAALLSGCAGLTRPWLAPEVALAGLRVKELALERQTFIVTLAVKNPNDRVLPIKAMSYRLTLEGRELARGGGGLDRQIPAFGESLVDAELSGSLLGLLGRLPGLVQKGEPLDWGISGTVTIANGLVTLPYRYTGRVDPSALLAQFGAGPLRSSSAEASSARLRAQ